MYNNYLNVDEGGEGMGLGLWRCGGRSMEVEICKPLISKPNQNCTCVGVGVCVCVCVCACVCVCVHGCACVCVCT